MSDDIHLKDREFLDLLKSARALLDKQTSIKAVDSTSIGNKYTETNVGLCNDDDLATKENSLWPEQFPQRKAIKYRHDYQKCPLDARFQFPKMGNPHNGCFYTCRVFKRRRYGPITIEEAKKLYDEIIAIWEEKLKGE